MNRALTDHGLEWLGRLIIEPRRFVLSLSASLGINSAEGPVQSLLLFDEE